MIEIGGMQMLDKPDHLSEDVQKWLDEAKDGAIWFSLGSNVKSSELPVDKLNAFINVFSKLKQRILLKWEAGELPRKLENVLTVKWVPSQADVLGKSIYDFLNV
jgi:glucuronosyltransferase